MPDTTTTTRTVREWLDAAHGLAQLADLPGLNPDLAARADLLREFAARVMQRFQAHRQRLVDRLRAEHGTIPASGHEDRDAVEERIETVLASEVSAPYAPLGLTRTELQEQVRAAVAAGGASPGGTIYSRLRPMLEPDEGDAADPVESELDRVFADDETDEEG